jgi:type II secretory pathway pseudopilin PulG
MKLNNQGSLIIEVLVSVALLTVFSLAIGSLAMANNRVITTSKNETQATALAKEAMEQMLALKNENWQKIPAPGDYLVKKEGTAFKIEPSLGVTIDNFTRTIQIVPAYRDVNNNLTFDNTQALDPNTKRLEVKVFWQERGADKNVSLAAYITNWKGQ